MTSTTPTATPALPESIHKIVIGIRLWPEAADIVRERFPGIEVVVETDPDKVADHLADADVYSGYTLTPEQLDAAPKLRWIHAMSAGVEHWVRAGIGDRGILLTNSSGVHATNIAEHVFAMALAFARQLPTLLNSQRERKWREWDDFNRTVFELDGQTMAILGTGAIGSAVAMRAKAFGLNTIGVRRSTTDEQIPGIDEQVSFDDMRGRLGEVDHVVVCLPMTEETAGLVSAEVIAAMKPGAHFYNIGRGGIVDQDALIAALQSGHLGGAGLDVTTPEPLPEDSPLWDAPNVIITAHTSGNTPKYGERALALFAGNLEKVLDGQQPDNVVDVSAGY